MDTLIDLATIYLVIEIVMSIIGVIVGIFVGIPILISVIRQITKEKKVHKLSEINEKRKKGLNQ